MGKTIYTPEQKALTSLLKRLREEAGLTQTEMADRLGNRQSFVSKYESGERRLDLIEVRQICAALGISLSLFIKKFERSLGNS